MDWNAGGKSNIQSLPIKCTFLEIQNMCILWVMCILWYILFGKVFSEISFVFYFYSFSFWSVYFARQFFWIFFGWMRNPTKNFDQKFIFRLAMNKINQNVWISVLGKDSVRLFLEKYCQKILKKCYVHFMKWALFSKICAFYE